MLSTLALALLPQLGAPMPMGGLHPGRRPSVVIVIADDLAVEDLEAVATPHIDSLAASGTTFSRAYANPVCSPSRRSLMFGQWWGADSAGVCGDYGPESPSPALLSLPDVMRMGGYATALFGKWHLGSTPVAEGELSPMLHGFDTWRAGSEANVKNCGSHNYSNWIRIDDGVAEPTTEYNTIAVRDEFVAWWLETSGPKFAVVSYQAPHVPFHTPPIELLPDGHSTPTTEAEEYAALIASLDTVVGDMLDVIDRDTFLIFLGDNGTPDRLAERAKTTTFERGIHVPLIVSHPSLPARESSALVHLVDVMATVASLASIPIPPAADLDSRSFVASIHGPQRGRAWVLCQTEEFDDLCVRTETHKLRLAHGVEELYDLVADPRELAPLDLEEPLNQRLANRLRKVLVRELE